MTRSRRFTFACLVALLVPSASSAAAKPGTSTVIVRFEHGALEIPHGKAATSLDEASIRTPGLRLALLKVGATRVTRLFPDFVPGAVKSTNLIGETVQLEDLSDYYVVSVEPGRAVSAALGLVGTRGILSAAPPGVGGLNTEPNDEHFPDQWYLHNTVLSCTPSDVDANALEAWDIVPNVSSSVRLGVVDTGVRSTHPDLVGRVDPTMTFTFANDIPCICLSDPGALECETDCDKDPGTSVQPIDEHGTQVAGTIGATKDNSDGVAGIASGATIVPLKVFNFTGVPLACWVARAIDKARNEGVPVVNLSVRSQPDAGLLAAVRNAHYAGLLLVGAIGNHGTAPGAPQREYPHAYAKMVCAVGAVDANGKRWTGSSYGSWLDLCAAGGAHHATTSLDEGPNCGFTNAYSLCVDNLKGTSLTAPVVTGVAGLLLSKYPAYNLLGEDLQQIMSYTAKDVTGADPKPGYFYAAGWDSLTGYGYVRADAALNFIAAPKQLEHAQVAGLNVVETTPKTVTFMNMPCPQMNGTRSVVRYKLRKAVTFSMGFKEPTIIWTRSSGTIGAIDTATFDYNTEVNTGRIVPGTLSCAGCTVETYVYQVFDQGNPINCGPDNPNGWFPIEPSGARVAFTTVREPDPNPDTTPPAATSDLDVDAVSSNSMFVIWTAPGGDGTTGTAAAYDLRRSTSPITPTNFASATQVTTNAPQAAGSFEQAYVQSLAACRWYYFALKTRDCAGNWSDMSNVTSARTSCGGGGGPAANSPTNQLPAVADLVVVSLGPGSTSAVLQYSVPAVAEGQALDLSIFDVSGRRIRTLVQGGARAGVHTIAWDQRTDGSAIAGRGVYFVRFTLAGAVITRRLVVPFRGQWR